MRAESSTAADLPLLPPFAPDAVVFDLDGVLVDSESVWEDVEREVVIGLGYPWDPSIRPLLLGKGPREVAELLNAALGGDMPVDQVVDGMATKSEEFFARGVPVASGALELVEALHGQLPLAVATNSRRVLAEHALVGNGLDIYFETVVTADDVAAHKPAPDPYLLACERIGARPARSVAIEDSPPGMASAKAAGLWVIACVPDGEGFFDSADHRVRSLRELDAAAFLGE